MEHHGDDVCGGSCVDVRQISRTIPTIDYLQGRSFSFLPEPLSGLSLIGCTSGIKPKWLMSASR